MEVGLELAVLHFGIDFLDEQGIFRAAGFLVACAESRLYLVDVMLVDLSLQLEIGQVVDLGDLRAGRDPLSELCVEPAYLAVDRRLDAQISSCWRTSTIFSRMLSRLFSSCSICTSL